MRQVRTYCRPWPSRHPRRSRRRCPKRHPLWKLRRGRLRLRSPPRHPSPAFPQFQLCRQSRPCRQSPARLRFPPCHLCPVCRPPLRHPYRRRFLRFLQRQANRQFPWRHPSLARRQSPTIRQRWCQARCRPRPRSPSRRRYQRWDAGRPSWNTLMPGPGKQRRQWRLALGASQSSRTWRRGLLLRPR